MKPSLLLRMPVIGHNHLSMSYLQHALMDWMMVGIYDVGGYKHCVDSEKALPIHLQQLNLGGLQGARLV